MYVNVPITLPIVAPELIIILSTLGGVYKLVAPVQEVQDHDIEPDALPVGTGEPVNVPVSPMQMYADPLRKGAFIALIK